MAERLFEINYSAAEGLTMCFRPSCLGLVPEPTRQHIRAANRELLLALRSFVDQAVEMMGPEGRADGGPRRVRVTDEDDEIT